MHSCLPPPSPLFYRCPTHPKAKARQSMINYATSICLPGMHYTIRHRYVCTCCEYFTFVWTLRIQALVYTGWTVEFTHSGLLRHGTNNFSALYGLLEKLGHAYGCCHGSNRQGHMTVCSMALYTLHPGVTCTSFATWRSQGQWTHWRRIDYMER